MDKRERIPYAVFFAGIGLTGLGSAWYHLNPDNSGLFWDRLTMAVAFMSLLAAIINDRSRSRAGTAALIPLVLFGIFTVAFWYLGELREHGDLRPYAFAQYYPAIAIPLLLLLFPGRYTRTGDLIVTLGWYLAAKICEVTDAAIYYGLGKILSGHTLKHLSAAVAVFWVYRMLRKRRPAPAVPSQEAI